MQKNPITDQLAAMLRIAIARVEIANGEGNPILSAQLPDMRDALAKYEAMPAVLPSKSAATSAVRQTLEGDVAVELDLEGAGRYTAYLAHPARGRVRVGTVLGGGRSWVAEPIGGAPPIRGLSRAAVLRGIGEWGLTQPGGLALAKK